MKPARPFWRRLSVATFASDRAMLALGVLATLVVATILCLATQDMFKSLGDSDDALRLAMVRDLLHGRGWWDQHVTRLQPPLGLWMQWSRLIDGGIAGLDRLFSVFAAPDRAEALARVVWPMLWIAPSIIASLFAARRLAPEDARGAAVIVCAGAAVATPFLIYRQFLPGRIDHHGPQIALCLVAAAGALQDRGVRGALVAGLATGLGLAVGLEALIPDAVIGAWIASRFLRSPTQGPAVAVYAASLLVSLTLAFLIQTPPGRWGLGFCDGLGVNLVLAVGAACLATLAAVALTKDRPAAVRAGALGAAGLIALAVFSAAKPACLAGPFAEIDPRIRAAWLDHVIEVQPLFRFTHSDPNTFVLFVIPLLWGLAGTAALLWLRRREGKVEPELLFWVGLLLLSVVLAAAAVRMAFYPMWFALPALAALAAELLRRFHRVNLLWSTALGFAFSGSIPGAIAMSIAVMFLPPKPAAPQDHCSEPGSYAELARLPPGLTAAEIDLGGYIVASTPSSALASPYHRAAWGMLSEEDALSSKADAASRKLRALGVRYVLECRAHARKWSAWSPDSLQRRLDAGRTPDWLERLSPPGAPLEVYRIRPAKGGE